MNNSTKRIDGTSLSGTTPRHHVVRDLLQCMSGMPSIMQTMDAKGMARVRLGAAWAAFGLLTSIASLSVVRQVDEVFTGWLQRAAPLPDLPAAILVWLGNAEIVLTAVAVVGGLQLLRNRRSGIAAMWLVAGLAGASILAVTLKHVIVHPGPPYALGRPWLGGLTFATPYSFPSGHTLRTTLLAGTALRTNRALAAVLVVSMMLALVYMGDHWLSDVLGGLCLGWALIETGRALRTTRPRNYLPN